MVLDNVTNITANSTILATTQSLLLQGLTTKGAIALLIFSLGLLIGKLIGKSIERILEALDVSGQLNNIFRTQIKFHQIIGNIFSYACYVGVIIISLGTLGASIAVIDTLTIIIITISIIVLFFAIKDFLANFIAGIILQMRGTIHPGDTVFIDDVSGKVLRADLLFIRVKAINGDVLHIPTSLLLRKVVRVVHKAQQKNT